MIAHDLAYELPEGLAEWLAWRQACIDRAAMKRTLSQVRALPETAERRVEW